MITITYRQKVSEGSYTSVPVTNVFQWPVTGSYAKLDNGQFDYNDTTFYVWADHLPVNLIPTWGDKLTDDLNRTWLVQNVDTLVRRQQFRLHCKKDL